MALHRSAVRFGSSSHRAKQVTVSSRPGSVSGTVARGRAVPVPLQRVQGTEYGPVPSTAALKMASPPLATMRISPRSSGLRCAAVDPTSTSTFVSASAHAADGAHADAAPRRWVDRVTAGVAVGAGLAR